MVISHRFGPMGQPAGCRICGGKLSFHQQVAGQLCSNWRCKAAILNQEMVSHREKAAAVIGVRRPESYPMVVVPDDPAGISRLPQSRIQAHINFLFGLCLQAVTSKDVDDDGTASVSDSSGFDSPAVTASSVCAVCRGACCHLGKTHAFLDTTAIRRFILHSVLKDPLEIVYAYFAHLPEKAVSHACVYQTEKGCTLPRRMRADICNDYRCKGLMQVEELIRRDDTGRIYVVVRKDNRITRAAFVQDDRIRHYPSTDRINESVIPIIQPGKEA